MGLFMPSILEWLIVGIAETVVVVTAMHLTGLHVREFIRYGHYVRQPAKGNMFISRSTYSAERTAILILAIIVIGVLSPFISAKVNAFVNSLEPLEKIYLSLILYFLLLIYNYLEI